MANETTSDEPMMRVFPVKKGRDMTLIWAGIIRELTEKTSIHDDGQRIVAVVNTEKGRVSIKGHVLSPAKWDAYLAKSPSDHTLSSTAATVN